MTDSPLALPNHQYCCHKQEIPMVQNSKQNLASKTAANEYALPLKLVSEMN